MAGLEEPLIPTPSNTGVENFIRGFSLVAQNNYRSQQEALRAQTLVQNTALREQALENQKTHNDQTFQYQQGQLQTKESAIALDQKEMDYKQGHTDEQLSDAKSMMDEIAGLTVPKHTQDWRDQANDILLRHPNAAKTPQYNNILQTVQKEKDPSYRSQQIVWENARKGVGITSDDPFENPNIVHTGKDEQGNPKVFFQQGYQMVLDPNTRTMVPAPKWATVSPDKWEQLNAQYKALNGDPRSGRPAPPKMVDASVVANARASDAKPGANHGAIRDYFRQKYGAELDDQP